MSEPKKNVSGLDPRDASRGQFPTVEIGSKLYYVDYQGNPWPTLRQAIEANARIEDSEGRQPCQRGLDIPGFIPKEPHPKSFDR